MKMDKIIGIGSKVRVIGGKYEGVTGVVVDMLMCPGKSSSDYEYEYTVKCFKPKDLKLLKKIEDRIDPFGGPNDQVYLGVELIELI